MKDIFESSPDVLIAEAKGSFNKLFRTSDYQKIIADDDQLKKLIDLLNVKSHCAYLDLATGTGYVGFALAERYPECLVVGLDIANEVINENLTQVKERDLSNIEFRIYDGITFPDFETNFDGVICRYALHHFPKVHETLDDISRVLKENGRVTISDAVRNEGDNDNFINKFQGLKKDGHVKMYTENELIALFREHDFTEIESFYSKITFSRELDARYESLLKSTSPAIKEKYCLLVADNKVKLTFDILNAAFVKKP